MYYALLLLTLIHFSSALGFQGARLRLRDHTTECAIHHRARTIFFVEATLISERYIDIACEVMNGNVTLKAPTVKIRVNDFNLTTLNIEITDNTAKDPIIIVTKTPQDRVRKKITANRPIVFKALRNSFKFDEARASESARKHNEHIMSRTRAHRTVAAASSTAQRSPQSSRSASPSNYSSSRSTTPTLQGVTQGTQTDPDQQLTELQAEVVRLRQQQAWNAQELEFARQLKEFLAGAEARAAARAVGAVSLFGGTPWPTPNRGDN